MTSSGSLHSRLAALAETFANDVLSAIRGASLDELAPAHGARESPRGGRNGAPRTPSATPPVRTTLATTPRGRLAQRSPEDIANALGLVVAALKGSKGQGMRAEEIRDFLKLDRRELPRVLDAGLKSKAIRKRGQKRATVYTAA